MSDLNKNYDESRMTWNEHDRAFHEETVDTIYKKIAEVIVPQNERFFQEMEKHHRRLCVTEDRISDHEKRIRRLELQKKIKVAMWLCLGIALGAGLYIIF